MLHNTYDDQECSIARALEAVGERWTLLVLRELSIGCDRFDDIQANLGIATNLLATRLKRLTDIGVARRVPYQQRPARFRYELTEKGRDLLPVLAALMHWGDRYHPCESGPPGFITHGSPGHRVELSLRCVDCGEAVSAGDAHVQRGRPT